MEQYSPKVSIVIPVYNGSNFLKDAIDSALAQTYKNIEILVVNDGSNDEGATEAIAKSYGNKIRYFHKENGGVSSALNLGIKEMTGDWFSWLSHDDLYTSKKIEHSIDVLRKNKTNRAKLIVYTDGLLVRGDKSVIKPYPHYYEPGKIYSGREGVDSLLKNGTLGGCCLLIPKDAFHYVGGFNESLRYSQDALMWYLLFLNGYSICSTGTKDVLSRVHKKQVTNTRKDLFVKDSLTVAQILFPYFEKENGARQIIYDYIKRLTNLNCEATVDYLLEYSLNHSLLSNSEVKILNRRKYLGRLIFNVKTTIRRILAN